MRKRVLIVAIVILGILAVVVFVEKIMNDKMKQIEKVLNKKEYDCIEVMYNMGHIYKLTDTEATELVNVIKGTLGEEWQEEQRESGGNTYSISFKDGDETILSIYLAETRAEISLSGIRMLHLAPQEPIYVYIDTIIREANSMQVLENATQAPGLPEITEAPQSTEKVKSAEAPAPEEPIDWFAAYNGEKLQRITAQSIESYSPALCPDIIFYRAEEGEAIDEILNKMIDAMIQPLTEPSEVRPFTITEYRLEEQAYEIYDENVPGVWILPYLNGYYSYTGTDFVTMETIMENEPELVKDGMVPFLRQGSEEVFVYILMQEGNVYRLQRAQDMAEVQE